jgi:hypothetical protein
MKMIIKLNSEHLLNAHYLLALTLNLHNESVAYPSLGTSGKRSRDAQPAGDPVALRHAVLDWPSHAPTSVSQAHGSDLTHLPTHLPPVPWRPPAQGRRSIRPKPWSCLSLMPSHTHPTYRGMKSSKSRRLETPVQIPALPPACSMRWAQRCGTQE